MRKYRIHASTLEAHGDRNNGFFDVLLPQEENGEYPMHFFRRMAGCSMGANIKTKDNITYMYIPLHIFGELSSTAKEELIDSLKEWVRFGRQCLIPAEYVGCMDVRDMPIKIKGPHTLNAMFGDWDDDMEGYYASDDDQTAMIIKWEHNDQINSKHGLGILSFFRYFYSSLSQEVYRNSIWLFNTFPKWNELKCLMFAHYMAKQAYTGYYGLIEKGWLFYAEHDLNALYTQVKKQNSVNNQWTFKSPLILREAFRNRTMRDIMVGRFGFIPNVQREVRPTTNAMQAGSLLYASIRKYLTSEMPLEEKIKAIELVDNALLTV